MILLSVIYFLFLLYLLGISKREVFKEVPFGDILIKFFENDMKDLPEKKISFKGN